MGFNVEVKPGHVHVTYTGLVDSFDLVSILSVSEFVDNARRLKRVVFDYSQSDGTHISEEDIRQVSTLMNLESHFTEDFFALVIPKDKHVRDEFNILKAIIKSDKSIFEIAENYDEATTLLNTHIAMVNASIN